MQPNTKARQSWGVMRLTPRPRDAVRQAAKTPGSAIEISRVAFSTRGPAEARTKRDLSGRPGMSSPTTPSRVSPWTGAP